MPQLSRKKPLPYLSSEPHTQSKVKMGFLHLRNPERKLEIGAVATREFKLVQCLFSPQNFIAAKHKSVPQTHERVLHAMRTNEKPPATRPAEHAGALSQSYTLIKNSIKRLEEKEVGNFLTFNFQEDKVQMTIA